MMSPRNVPLPEAGESEEHSFEKLFRFCIRLRNPSRCFSPCRSARTFPESLLDPEISLRRKFSSIGARRKSFPVNERRLRKKGRRIGRSNIRTYGFSVPRFLLFAFSGSLSRLQPIGRRRPICFWMIILGYESGRIP